jgi:PII-like signaling protein
VARRIGPHSACGREGGSANTLGLPLVIEIVDEEEAIERFLPTIDRLVGEGLVALEAVRVVKYPATAGG